MSFERAPSGGPTGASGPVGSQTGAAGIGPGKRSLTDLISPAPSASGPTSGGQPIPADVRAKLEQRLGADFSAVRVHEGDHPIAIGARAYTQGTNIHFAPGEYDPHSARGQELLGHELGHVIQQARGEVSATGVHTDPTLERDADAHGARAASSSSGGRGASDARTVIPSATGSAAPIQRKELDPTSLKESMTQTMRTDVPAAMGAIDPSLTNESTLLTEGIEGAKLVYAKACVSLKTKVPSLAPEIPAPAALTMDKIREVDGKIRACADITDSLGEQHWEQHKAHVVGKTREVYIEERNVAERVKAASAWSQTALPIVQLNERKSGLRDKRMIERREARDLNGRVGYMMMSTSTEHVMSSMGVDAADHATARNQGAGALSSRLIDLFSGAACHNDARLMTDLLSDHRHAGPTSRTVNGVEGVPAALDAIMSTVADCPGPTKLLKLSVYNNHSMLYVIGGGKAQKLETIAAPDSNAIMINDLIRNSVSEHDARSWITTGLNGLSRSSDDEPVTLEFEVHKATTMEGVEDRTQRQLGDRLSELGMGLVVGSWEMSKLRDEQAGSMTTGEDLTADYQVGPIAKKTQLKLPQNVTHRSGVTFHALDSAAVVAAPVAGTEYRISARGSWLRARVDQVIANGNPAWMHPMLQMTVVNVNPNLSNPVLVAAVGGGEAKQLFHWSMALADFNLMRDKAADLTGREFNGRDGSKWRVTADLQHATQGPMRPVTMLQTSPPAPVVNDGDEAD